MRSFLILFFLPFILNAQDLIHIDQSGYGMEYDLPSGWWYDEFSSSSVCDCPGSINGVDSPKVYMCVYPIEQGDDNDSVRNYVWDNLFKPSGVFDDILAKNISFKREIASWENDDLNSVVWRLTASQKKRRYIIYFWADADIMKENEATLMNILNSFMPKK